MYPVNPAAMNLSQIAPIQAPAAAPVRDRSSNLGKYLHPRKSASPGRAGVARPRNAPRRPPVSMGVPNAAKPVTASWRAPGASVYNLPMRGKQ